VPAYSTLGWFDDPLLSTFIGYPDAQLARLVFHELAHQLVYAKNDTTFNESFAVTVEEEGVKRWLESEGRAADLEAFRVSQRRKRDFIALVADTRKRVDDIYRADLPRETKLERKRAELEKLRAAWPGAIPADANNAFLVSIGVYTDLVPMFERLLAQSGSLEEFYARAKKLASSGKRDIDNLAERRPRT
jgi:predicted aminopeptidase